MVKIRLSRVGAKGQPYYRVVVVDERKKRDGKVLEVIGRYNPRTSPLTFEIAKERLKYWRGVGAQSSEAILVLLKEAKPKFHQPKNKKEEAPAAPLASKDAVAETAPEVPSEGNAPEATTDVPSEGASVVKTDAPETTPEASPELAEAIATSEESSPEASEEVVAQTVENSILTAKSPTPEENQPTTQDELVEVSETAQESTTNVKNPAEEGQGEQDKKE